MQAIQDLIKLSSEKYGIPFRFLLALAKRESSLNPLSIRYEPGYIWTYSVKEMYEIVNCSRDTMEMMQKTSWGVCQIMGAVAYEHGLRDWATKLLDPEINLKFACEYIHVLLRRHSEVKLENPLDVYACYNAGRLRKVDGRYINCTNVNAFKKVYESLAQPS